MNASRSDGSETDDKNDRLLYVLVAGSCCPSHHRRRGGVVCRLPLRSILARALVIIAVRSLQPLVSSSQAKRLACPAVQFISKPASSGPGVIGSADTASIHTPARTTTWVSLRRGDFDIFTTLTQHLLRTVGRGPPHRVFTPPPEWCLPLVLTRSLIDRRWPARLSHIAIFTPISPSTATRTAITITRSLRVPAPLICDGFGDGVPGDLPRVAYGPG